MVSMMSLIPIGMPSIGESGLPARQRSVERSAAVLAAARLSVTKAPIFGSQASSSAMQRSRNSRGESFPLAKSAVAGRNGCIRGFITSGAFIGSLALSLRRASVASRSMLESAGIRAVVRAAPECPHDEARLQVEAERDCYADAGAAPTAGSRERMARMIAFSISTTRKKIKPPRNSHGQTPSGSASVSNTDCSGGA